VMAESIEAKATHDVYELAYAVSERVEIDNIILAHCEAARSGSPISVKLKTTTIVSGISHASYPETKHIHVMVSFVLKATPRDEAESEEPLSIKAAFVLFYSIRSFDGIDDEHIKAFAATNGVFNAWPYWREFVQSTTGRMGLAKAVVVPVFRLGETKYTDQTSVQTPLD
jgi:hypothetical protein